MATAQSTETGPIVDVDAPPESSSPRRDEGADSLDPDAVEERMRVDRRKLEQMLQSEPPRDETNANRSLTDVRFLAASDGSDAETADAFFERVSAARNRKLVPPRRRAPFLSRARARDPFLSPFLFLGHAIDGRDRQLAVEIEDRCQVEEGWGLELCVLCAS